MNKKPNIKLPNRIPFGLLPALAKRRGNYSDMVSVFHCICVDEKWYVGVAGDGNNGSYEWFSFKDGVLTTSDDGYGSTTIALRAVLTKEDVY